MIDVKTVACGKCGTSTIDTISGLCISCRPLPVTLPSVPTISEADVMLAGIHAACVGASQEYTRCKGVMPQWDSGFFAGQMHVFDVYTKADKTAISEANEYLSKLNQAAPLPAAPAPTAPSTLGQQVARAKAEMAKWSPEQRASVRLQGGDAAAPTEQTVIAPQPIIGKLLDEMSQLQMLWGLNEPGALVRFSDVSNVLFAASKAARQAPTVELRDTLIQLATVQKQLIDANAEIAALLMGVHPDARQAPDSRDAALNLCEHMWELQPASTSVRMTEKCRFCREIREIATAQGKAQ